MKKLFAILLVVSIFAVPAVAGDKKKCDGDAEDCAKYMKTKYAEKAWLGIEYDTDEKGHWVVSKVVAKSPAQKAGFEKGDVMLAMDGVKYSKDNKAELKKVYSKLEPGSEVQYVVLRQGGKVKIDATLSNVPKEMQAEWIAKHMKSNHPEYKMASK